jgi:hypothetical protein
MRRARDDLRAPWVISVEQDAEHAEETRAMLAAVGLGDAAEILHAPIVQREFAGTRRSAYDVPLERVEAATAGRRVGFVLVDGPAAENGARVTTIPSIRHLLTGATPFVLDDAIRDGELETAGLWRRDGVTTHNRYLLADSGALLGLIRAP